jgi:HSP20 family protein
MKQESQMPIARRGGTGFTEQLFEPLSRLRSEVDRLFDDFPSRVPAFPFARSFASGPVPAVELVETDKEYKLTAELPGMEAGDIDITLADDVLTIAGEKKEEREEKKEGFMLSERSYGSFERRISVPAAADAENIKASFKNGVLTVSLPKDQKAEQAKRRIAVKQA